MQERIVFHQLGIVVAVTNIPEDTPVQLEHYLEAKRSHPGAGDTTVAIAGLALVCCRLDLDMDIMSPTN